LAVFTIKKGLDIPLDGVAEKKVADLPETKITALKPIDFPFHKFRLLVTEGDEVKIGTPLMVSKTDDSLLFTSTVSGKIRAIQRGDRRALTAIEIESNGADEALDFGAWSESKIASASTGDIATALKLAGVWPLIRQRPFSKIANPEVSPKAIFINAMATAPLAANQAVLCAGKKNEIQAGLLALSRFTTGKIYFITHQSETAPEFTGLKSVETHSFAGPHPSGLVSTHAAQLAPINKGDTIWYLSAQHLSLIGEFLLNGKTPTKQIVAVAGTGVKNRQYFRVRRQSRVDFILTEDTGSHRIIAGDVLSGLKISAKDALGYYDSLISVIPEGGEQYYLGSDKHWQGPGFGVYSVYNLFMSKLFPKSKWDLNTNLNGGQRAIVLSDAFEQVMPLDIYITQLVKACVAKDVEKMEQLGILEIDAEDVALSTFVCPSKTDACQIISDGLALIEKES
jgi:Na+-transporting NADH:ubiquinone oxidoreductase subunit A